MLGLCALLGAQLRTTGPRRRTSELGYSTEMVVVTAALVVLAIAATAVIAIFVLKKANGLQ
ncbi:MAG: hypothetical protein DLM65_08860 [Candidatus Aeolococcus gillhamiae]|uniref:Uncharacterized protein n=1 Tax=Candidatus Aeolococcus gillhamiae TaxID=3127015 RepID=A0A2W5ZBH1_9BACT|nr:MAG: hypothetical protein DLM65_08860 [Candidatus Dormibacter sp. RRmetagenome_bin12]